MAELNAQVSDSKPAGATGGTANGLSGLYRMSKTAGLGSGEYVAINNAAVATVLLGLASSLVLLHNILLIIPAVAVLFAIIAMFQIRGSNGTEKGTWIAGLGLLLALGFGGSRGWHAVQVRQQQATDRGEITQAVDKLESDFKADQLTAAYQRFSEGFRQRVPFARFQQSLRFVNRSPQWGELQDMVPEAYLFEDNSDIFSPTVNVRLLAKYSLRPEGVPLGIVMRRIPGGWEFGDIPQIFPSEDEEAGTAAPGGGSIMDAAAPGAG